MKRKIKLRYVDTMSNNYKNGVLWKLLSKWYDIDEVSAPDYIICGGMGSSFTRYKDCIRIQIIGENIVPDFNVFDYAIGFDHMQFGDRYLRVPLFVFYDAFQKMLSGEIAEIAPEKACKRKFCSYVVSNARNANPIRDNFFKTLCQYKKVDSAGRHLNNMGGSYLKNKKEFISQYKFNIAFENSSSDGYTTEKIIEPMAVGSIPIYWGNPSIEKDFNKESFICLDDFSTVEECIAYIKELDSNDSLYLDKLNQPWFPNNKVPDYNQRLNTFFEAIFNQPLDKARRVNVYGHQTVLANNLLTFYKKMDSTKSIKYQIVKIIKKIIRK